VRRTRSSLTIGTTAAPAADVFVATIIPLSSAAQENAARGFDAAIVQSKVAAGRRVHLVDMHSALSTADLIDGVHRADYAITGQWQGGFQAEVTGTARNVDHNNAVPAGGSVRFGLLGSAPVAAGVPTTRCAAR
jgi:hypothetical protein